MPLFYSPFFSLYTLRPTPCALCLSFISPYAFLLSRLTPYALHRAPFFSFAFPLMHTTKSQSSPFPGQTTEFLSVFYPQKKSVALQGGSGMKVPAGFLL
jgi:hypothetical protein